MFWPMLLFLAQVQEQITVERIIVDARVTDDHGNVILNLKPSDFRVRVDGKLATVESVDWIPETESGRELVNAARPQGQVNQTMNEPAPEGRLFVFLFQTDFGRAPSRVMGEMKIVLQSTDYTDFLEAGDRVAVLSHDSHLKFRLDFTDDKRQIRAAMEQALGIDDPPRPPKVPLPSLSRYLPADTLKKETNTIGDALILIANALRPIPGPKTIVFFSWGMGQLTPTGIYNEPNYAIARYALLESRVTVYSIDFTQADYHSLEFGLGAVAKDTGGFYAKTYTFPTQAVERLKGTLAGHYELEVKKPDIKAIGAHRIEVETTRKGTVVMARTTYFDGE